MHRTKVVRYRLRAAFVACVAAASACGSGEPAVDDDTARGAVDTIDTETIVRIASAQELGVDEARRAAVFDAVTAAAARRRTPHEWLERTVERAALARALLETLYEEARRDGPPTDAEVKTLTDARWWELDRPELRRTTHAVVLVKPKTDEKTARGVAERIRNAVLSATNRDEFAERAKGVSVPEGIELRVEHLAPSDREGRILDPKSPPASAEQIGRYADDYARAVFEMKEPLTVSPVVRSDFGFHVIFFEERIPAARIPFETRRSELAEEIWSRRARDLTERLLAEARERTPITVERSAAALTEKVRVVP